MIKLSPSIVGPGENGHKIGYVGFVNPNDNLVKQTQDVIVQLESSNPTIATVPSQIMIPAGSEFAVFEVTTLKAGTVKIFATFAEKTKFDTLVVGQNSNTIGNDLRLVINMPTSEMNVNSQMPFSLYLQDSTGAIAQAPFDIDVTLDYEDGLVGLETNELKINKGNSYVWSIIKSKDKVGNAFLRASSDRLGFDEAKEIRISSSLPSSLSVNIFPEQAPATLKRDIDVVVALKDSDGLPTLAQDDIKLQFFADDEAITRQIDRLIKEAQLNGIIKKGEFSYRLKLKLDLKEDKTYTIGATTKGLGVASDTFETVEPLTTNNPKAENKTLQIYTLNQIPTKSQALAIIQIGALIDEDETESEEETETEELVFHPVIVNENYVSSGGDQKINLISSNDLLVKIREIGNIDVTSTYGTALIETGQETGPVVLSTTIKGIGSASTTTEVINTLKQERTMIFSPTGSSAMLFDKNGYFDLFIVSLDTKGRPTIVENENRYLLSPINNIVSIEKSKTFSHLVFQGNAIQDQNKIITVSAIPIGESADAGLEVKNDFEIKPTAQLKTYIPFDTLNSDNTSYTGAVQVLDFYGNPIVQNSDLRVKLSPSEFDKVDIPEYVTIPAGSSYVEFPIETDEVSTISFVASSKGMVSGSKEVDVKSLITNLKISIGSVIEPIPVEQPTELTVYVDDEYQNAVGGVTLRVLSENSSVVSPTVTTSPDGSATIQFSPNNAPKMSLQILATAEGYSEEQETFQFAVSGGPDENKTILPEWMIYGGVAGVAGIAGGVIFFLKKPKKQLEEDEEELYE